MSVAIADIPEFDLDCWFGSANPSTCRAVAEHARRVDRADLAFPVILSADGALMDRGHRIAKAWLAGHEHVLAVRFVEDPEPDWTEPQATIDCDTTFDGTSVRAADPQEDRRA